MNENPAIVKERLTSLITKMSVSPALFVKNPEKDFTRDRKLPFETMIHLIISMGGNSIYKELLEAQGYDINTATTSAFIQQRDKINLSAFEFLLRNFTDSYSADKKYRGYRLLAVDGSDMVYSTNPDDSETYYQTSTEAKGYNMLHLNSVYDLCNRVYIDSLIQPGKQINEKRAIVEMVNRSCINDKTIIIADRNYES